MTEKSIFKGGKKELLELKEILVKYHEYERKIAEIVKKEEKQLQFNEERKQEIERAIIAREADLRKEVGKPFDMAVERYMNRKDELLSHKEEKRKAAIDIRIDQEKQEISNESNHYKKELQKIAQQDGLPWICNTKLFFAFFYPKTLSDAIVLVISLLWLLLAFPLGIFQLWFPDGGRLELTTIYLFIFALIFALYTLVNNTVKEKYKKTFEKMNDYRLDVDRTAKEIREIIQRVKEMSDEELICDVYTQEYITEVNKELEMLDEDIIAETAKKDAAIREFDENTAAKAEREVRLREMYQKEMKRRASALADIQSLKEIEQNNLALIEQLMAKFRPLEQVGIDIFDERMIDELLTYLRNREAKTIGGAIEQRSKAST